MTLTGIRKSLKIRKFNSEYTLGLGRCPLCQEEPHTLLETRLRSVLCTSCGFSVGERSLLSGKVQGEKEYRVFSNVFNKCRRNFLESSPQGFVKNEFHIPADGRDPSRALFYNKIVGLSTPAGVRRMLGHVAKRVSTVRSGDRVPPNDMCMVLPLHSAPGRIQGLYLQGGSDREIVMHRDGAGPLQTILCVGAHVTHTTFESFQEFVHDGPAVVLAGKQSNIVFKHPMFTA